MGAAKDKQARKNLPQLCGEKQGCAGLNAHLSPSSQLSYNSEAELTFCHRKCSWKASSKMTKKLCQKRIGEKSRWCPHLHPTCQAGSSAKHANPFPLPMLQPQLSYDEIHPLPLAMEGREKPGPPSQLNNQPTQKIQALGSSWERRMKASPLSLNRRKTEFCDTSIWSNLQMSETSLSDKLIDYFPKQKQDADVLQQKQLFTTWINISVGKEGEHRTGPLEAHKYAGEVRSMKQQHRQ